MGKNEKVVSGRCETTLYSYYDNVSVPFVNSTLLNNILDTRYPLTKRSCECTLAINLDPLCLARIFHMY